MDNMAIRLSRVRMFRSVRGRLLFWTIVVTLPIYAAALYMSYESIARRLEAGAQQDVDELTARLVAGVDAVIRPIEGGIRTLAYQLEEINPPREQYPQRILAILKAWPDVYGSTIAVEPDTTRTSNSFAPYFYRHGDEFSFSDLSDRDYAYRNRPWYRRAADTRQPIWSLPYFDAGGGDIWMVTYSMPFFRTLGNARELAGVVTADLDLNWVRRTAAGAALGPAAMGWLMSPPDGESLVVPIGVTPGATAQFDRALNAESIRRVGESMLARGVTFELLPRGIATKPAYLAVRHVETLSWRAMLVIPQAELLAEANELLNRQLWLGTMGLALLVLAVSGVAAGITRPLRMLAVAVSKAREPNVELQLPNDARRDEIGVLTEALRTMRGALKDHVRLRAESLAEQARLGHELQIAASIQQSMLPRSEAIADLPSAVQVATALIPAMQVGGDLYDCFNLHSGSILLAIGDVSDKGIPAALCMARLSALLRVEGAAGITPDSLLSRINARFADGNDACMFVTVGCGILDVNTGCLRYASAGHDAPLLRHAEGTVIPLDVENGPAIGIEPVAEYQVREAFMAPGDTLVLFTDGVTEAEAKDGSFFGTERLSALLSDMTDSDPKALVEGITETVAAHAPAFHATDDLTVLAVRWNPPEVTISKDGQSVCWHIEPEISPRGIRQTQHWLHAILAARDVAMERIADVELIAEELLTNIVRPGNASCLSVDCALAPTAIALTVHDNGPEFDPLSARNVDLDVDIEDREVGGLGILIVRKLASHCLYSRTDDWNVLKICLDLAPVRN